MANKNVLESFAHAFEGLSHVMWTQKHVRTQLFMVVLVLLLSYVMQIELTKMLFVLSAVALVLLAELFNTAIEVVVNMITQEYHPLAKIAKDVAAAGVLIASIYALMVGGGIFLSGNRIHRLLGGAHSFGNFAQPSPIVVLLLCFMVLSIFVALGKSRKQHGSILQGGAVSGHTAVAFMLFAAIAIYSQFAVPITVLAFLLAVLVAQSRVEGKIHTLAEVLWGALFAIVLMAIVVIFST
jgi:diacylglycerol kinase (ATP)